MCGIVLLIGSLIAIFEFSFFANWCTTKRKPFVDTLLCLFFFASSWFGVVALSVIWLVFWLDERGKI